MNERIQELKRQASMWCDQNIPGEFDENTGGYGYHWEEKFAELIVKECAGIYDKIDNGNLHMGTDNYLKALQKHFEVER